MASKNQQSPGKGLAYRSSTEDLVATDGNDSVSLVYTSPTVAISTRHASAASHSTSQKPINHLPTPDNLCPNEPTYFIHRALLERSSPKLTNLITPESTLALQNYSDSQVIFTFTNWLYASNWVHQQHLKASGGPTTLIKCYEFASTFDIPHFEHWCIDRLAEENVTRHTIRQSYVSRNSVIKNVRRLLIDKILLAAQRGGLRQQLCNLYTELAKEKFNCCLFFLDIACRIEEIASTGERLAELTAKNYYSSKSSSSRERPE